MLQSQPQLKIYGLKHLDWITHFINEGWRTQPFLSTGLECVVIRIISQHVSIRVVRFFFMVASHFQGEETSSSLKSFSPEKDLEFCHV